MGGIMKDKFFNIVFGVVFVLILTGCSKKDTIETNIIMDNDYHLIVVKKANCENETKEYYEYNGQKIFLVCLDEIYLKNEHEKITLSKYMQNLGLSYEEVLNKLLVSFKMTDALYDGGTTIYRNDSLSIIKCNTLDNNKDIYIGNQNLAKEENYCK